MLVGWLPIFFVGLAKSHLCFCFALVYSCQLVKRASFKGEKLSHASLETSFQIAAHAGSQGGITHSEENTTHLLAHG